MFQFPGSTSFFTTSGPVVGPGSGGESGAPSAFSGMTYGFSQTPISNTPSILPGTMMSSGQTMQSTGTTQPPFFFQQVNVPRMALGQQNMAPAVQSQPSAGTLFNLPPSIGNPGSPQGFVTGPQYNLGSPLPGLENAYLAFSTPSMAAGAGMVRGGANLSISSTGGPGTPGVSSSSHNRGTMSNMQSKTSMSGAKGFPGVLRQGIDKTKMKTKMCSFWTQQGHCGWGDECAFAHGEQELANSHKILEASTPNDSAISQHQTSNDSNGPKSQGADGKISTMETSTGSSSQPLALPSGGGTSTNSTSSFSSAVNPFPPAPNPSLASTRNVSTNSSLPHSPVLAGPPPTQLLEGGGRMSTSTPVNGPASLTERSEHPCSTGSGDDIFAEFFSAPLVPERRMERNLESGASSRNIESPFSSISNLVTPSMREEASQGGSSTSG